MRVGEVCDGDCSARGPRPGLHLRRGGRADRGGERCLQRPAIRYRSVNFAFCSVSEHRGNSYNLFQYCRASQGLRGRRTGRGEAPTLDFEYFTVPHLTGDALLLPATNIRLLLYATEATGAAREMSGWVQRRDGILRNRNFLMILWWIDASVYLNNRQ